MSITKAGVAMARARISAGEATESVESALVQWLVARGELRDVASRVAGNVVRLAKADPHGAGDATTEIDAKETT